MIPEWSDGPLSGAIQSATAAGATLIDNGQEALVASTVARIHGHLVCWLEAVGTIGDGFTRLAAGIGIVSADAFAVGATAVPSPSADQDWSGWMWHYAGGPIVGFSVTESENTGPVSQIRIPIDVKAMRKMKPNEVIFGSVGLSAEVGVATISFGMHTRMLSLA